MRRTRKFAAAAAAGILTLALAACGGSESDGSGDSGGSSDVRVGMAYDVGGRGDQSFNDLAAKGMDKAADEFGLETQEAEATDGEPESAREERLRTFADNGFDPVVAVGFAYAPSIEKVAPEYPDVNFVLIDDATVTGDNITNLVFAEEQGSFLVGAAAAMKSKSDHIGYVGGVQTPLIQKFEAGYVAGAKAVNPKITIDTTYLSQPPDFSGFGDPAKGRTAAKGMYDNGADVVYHAAGGSGGGVFEAASDSGNWAIGVDSDQYNTADDSVKESILTSMTKHLDVAVYDYLAAMVEGEAASGVQRFDLAKDGVGYSTSGGKIDDITDKLDEYKQKIIDGEIKVPEKP